VRRKCGDPAGPVCGNEPTEELVAELVETNPTDQARGAFGAGSAKLGCDNGIKLGSNDQHFGGTSPMKENATILMCRSASEMSATHDDLRPRAVAILAEQTQRRKMQ
jgi:hypothetical protein